MRRLLSHPRADIAHTCSVVHTPMVMLHMRGMLLQPGGLILHTRGLLLHTHVLILHTRGLLLQALLLAHFGLKLPASPQT